MKLSAPKQVLWIIAVILGILGIVGKLVTVAFVTTYAFWLVTIGLVILVIGTAMKGA
jgi:hypothetical protein